MAGVGSVGKTRCSKIVLIIEGAVNTDDFSLSESRNFIKSTKGISQRRKDLSVLFQLLSRCCSSCTRAHISGVYYCGVACLVILAYSLSSEFVI